MHQKGAGCISKLEESMDTESSARCNDSILQNTMKDDCALITKCLETSMEVIPEKPEELEKSVKLSI